MKTACCLASYTIIVKLHNLFLTWSGPSSFLTVSSFFPAHIRTLKQTKYSTIHGSTPSNWKLRCCNEISSYLDSNFSFRHLSIFSFQSCIILVIRLFLEWHDIKIYITKALENLPHHISFSTFSSLRKSSSLFYPYHMTFTRLLATTAKYFHNKQ